MKLENRLLSEMKIGDSAELRRLIAPDDLYVFAVASGNFNPMHLPELDGDGDGKADGVAPGMFVGSLISAVLGTMLPGPGTLYRAQSLEFHERAHAGEELVSRVTVVGKDDTAGTVRLDTEVRRLSDDAAIVTGTAEVFAPRAKFSRDDVEVPGLVVQRHRHFKALIEQARNLPPVDTVVVAPEEAQSLKGALLAAREGIINPILVGAPDRISQAAAELEEDISAFELVEAMSHELAASLACTMVNDGRAAAVMKGHLHTDELLRPMLERTTGLRAGKRFTHVFVMDVPGTPRPIMVTDAAINIAPDLPTKMDIVQNAIDLARSLGMAKPRVAVLSAVETVNPAIQSSIDAALLSKMADRGQIKGGIVDGPLAMDNAVDLTAARTKGIGGEVAGHADILVVPGIDAGNMLAKQLAYVSHAEAAGLVLGAKVPVILNSRSDSAMSRLASCAVAALHQARIASGAA